MSVKTHKFNGVKYKISYAAQIDGICDYEGKELTELCGNGLGVLGSVLEEGMHAMNIPDKFLHKPKSKVRPGQSCSKVDDLARFLWRLGYRKKQVRR